MHIHLPHFNLGSEPGNYPRGLRRGGGSGEPDYEKETAEKYITDLESYTDTLENKLPTFWLFRTKPEYPINSEAATDAIEYLGGELVKVVSENSGIVKLPAGFTQQFKETVKKNLVNKRISAKIPAYVGKVLGGKIREWRGEEKVSEFLLKSEVDESVDMQKFMDTETICLSFFNLKNETEKQALKQRLIKKIQQVSANYFDNESFNTITVYSAKKSDILGIANDDFVEYIDPVLKLNYGKRILR